MSALEISPSEPEGISVDIPSITDREFVQFRKLIYELAGIHLGDNKKALVHGRLAKRLRHHQLNSFSDYISLVTRPDASERQIMVDLLTTNETYFFREDKHFSLLKEILARYPAGSVKAWSAACSTGQEAYSMAMVMAEERGLSGFEIIGTDISSRVLERAKSGIYPQEQARQIPPGLLRRYCLRGVREQAGHMRIERRLRERISFESLNLNGSWPGLPRFHFIFLRNVMIYFDGPTKTRLVERVAGQLQPGGYLFVGHSEGLAGIRSGLVPIIPSVYRLGDA